MFNGEKQPPSSQHAKKGVEKQQTGKISNTVRATLVAVGALMPRIAEHEAPSEKPVAVTQASQASQGEGVRYEDYLIAHTPVEVHTVSEDTVETNLATISTENLLTSYHNTESSDVLKRMEFLIALMKRELPPATKDTLLRDYTDHMFSNGEDVIETLELLSTFNVTLDNTPWLRDKVVALAEQRPDIIVEAQPKWPDDAPTAEFAESLEQHASTYTAIRDILAHDTSPRTQALIHILDSTRSAHEKQDLMFFLDDVAEGKISEADATSALYSDDILFSHLIERARTKGATDEVLVGRLRKLASGDSYREEVLRRVTGI